MDNLIATSTEREQKKKINKTVHINIDATEYAKSGNPHILHALIVYKVQQLPYDVGELSMVYLVAQKPNDVSIYNTESSEFWHRNNIKCN